MIIKDSDRNEFVRPKKGRFFKRVPIVKWMLFLLLTLIIISSVILSQKVKAQGYNNLYDFITTFCSNYIEGVNSQPEQIAIIIKNKDFKVLEKNRQQALERGVIINDMDGEYVPAEIEYQRKKIKIKLRLKGHMTDHLQDNKWSFRIKVQNKDFFMGMKRFSIQHPGTRGYIYEWIYHELMRHEGVIALRYKFINVSVNGKDWGIYAVEENFEKELIENNQRKKGPILRFDPDMYWVHRYNMMKSESAIDEFASYYSANPVAYREEDILKDSVQANNYLKGIALMEGIRNKKITVENAFDIKLLAKFHAVIDLVGGQHAIDWSDIKYYYNPVTNRLEPIAYESFTKFPIRELSGMYRFSVPDSLHNYVDWHTTLFSDPAFFKAYAEALNRIADPEYLNTFFSKLNDELKQNLAILNKEFAFKKFDKELYYKSQRMIKKMLDPPRAILAYYNGIDNSTIRLQVGNIESLPVEVKSVTIGNYTLKLDTAFVVPSKQANVIVQFSDLKIALPAHLKWNDSLADNININYSILGVSKLKQELVHSFPHTSSSINYTVQNDRLGNIKKFKCLAIDEERKVITFKSGKQPIKEDMVIPKGYRLIVNAGTLIDLQSKARIISYSPVFFLGEEEEPIIVNSSDSSGQGLLLYYTGESKFEYTRFMNFSSVKDAQFSRSSAITVYDSKITLQNCSFYNSKAKSMVGLIRTSFLISRCSFNRINGDALNIDFSTGTLVDCSIENCDENAININRCTLSLNSIYLKAIKNKGINVEGGTQLTGGKLIIEDAKSGITVREASNVSFENISMSNVDEGIVVDRNSSKNTSSVVRILSLLTKNVSKDMVREKGSVVTIKNEKSND